MGGGRGHAPMPKTRAREASWWAATHSWSTTPAMTATAAPVFGDFRGI